MKTYPQRSMVPGQGKQNGITVFGALLLVIIVLPILVLAFYQGRKAYWDWRVDEMCEKDGGVRIFEKVRITAAETELLPRANGKLSTASESLSKPGSPVFSRTKIESLHGPNPNIERVEVSVIRRSDSNVVAGWVRYSRGGGDVPSFGHPSVYGCPDYASVSADLEKLFVINGGGK